jgi:hypothetical protein
VTIQRPYHQALAIIALLLQMDRERDNRLAHEAFEAEPTNSTFVSTYAFALHLPNKTGEGLSGGYKSLNPVLTGNSTFPTLSVPLIRGIQLNLHGFSSTNYLL